MCICLVHSPSSYKKEELKAYMEVQKFGRTYFSAGYVSDIKLLQIKQLNICLDLTKPAKDAVLAIGLAALP